ncbi:MAG TPA: hypothetical protein VNW99_05240 [Cytophagaceae bacterium]|jgi:hypothetical protein|nr:hypothetical protein [Cytophagaceae bacterium]
MKKIIIGLSLLSLMTSAFAQRKENDPKHEYHYRSIPTIETEDIKIEIVDAHSQREFTKMKLKITNKTDDYIVFRPSETIMKNEKGEFNLTDKDIIIGPLESDNKVLTFKGIDMHVKQMSLLLKGFYKFPSKGEVQKAPDFVLPASSNDFTAGPFSCTLLKSSKETDKTEVQFKCTYNGNDFGILKPSKIVVKTEKGQEYATAKSTQKTTLLTKGKKDNFTATFVIPGKVVDMQFANLAIVWKDTFSESKQSAITVPSSFNFELDPGLTAGKNK